MHTSQVDSPMDIVHAPSRSLATRSVALVERGLRDLTRKSNWRAHRALPGIASHFAISATGKLCVLLPSAGSSTQRFRVYDMEKPGSSALTFFPAANPQPNSSNASAAFAWSPAARYLVAASPAWQPEMQIFDLQTNVVLGGFAVPSNCPNYLAWSAAGKFLGASSPEPRNPSLAVWNVSSDGEPFSAAPSKSLGAPSGCDRQTPESEFGDDGTFKGYGRMAFSPDGKSLAAVLEYKGDWADDSLLITDAHSLLGRNVFHAHGRVTDVSWTQDSRAVVYCAGGQAYRLNATTMECQEMFFAAELCACHPFLPVCVCFSSWLKNSAEGRLCVIDLDRREVLDECAADGIIGLRWSGDGSKAYGLTQDGSAYIYESPIF